MYPEPPYAGRCLCGATRYSCGAKPIWQALCHCESCRRASSAPYMAWFAVPPQAVEWGGEALREHQSSPGIFRGHCAICATPMTWRRAANPGSLDLAAATLEDPGAFHPETHDFWEERLTWVVQDESLPFCATRDVDADAVLTLIRTAFAGMEGRIDPPSSMHLLTGDEIRAQAEKGQLWLIGTPPVACVFMAPEQDHLYLSKLAVDPAAQRHGHARALIRAAEGIARAKGLAALELSTRVELVENHATFRALGFQLVGHASHSGFDRPTSLHFRKEL